MTDRALASELKLTNPHKYMYLCRYTTHACTKVSKLSKRLLLLYQCFPAHFTCACAPSWQKTTAPLLGGEFRLICTCSTPTSSHMPASLKHWVRKGSTDTELGCIWTHCPLKYDISLCRCIDCLCNRSGDTPTQVERGRKKNRMWAIKQKKVEVCNVEQRKRRDRNGGRERMEVDGETLNHWWRSSRIHYGLSWKQDNARVVAMGEVARRGTAAVKCCVTKRCSKISTLTINYHYISVYTALGRKASPTWRACARACVCVRARCLWLNNTMTLTHAYLAR